MLLSPDFSAAEPSFNPNWRPKEFVRLSNANESMHSELSELRRIASQKTRENARLHAELESLRNQNSALSRRKSAELTALEEEHQKATADLKKTTTENADLLRQIRQLQIDAKRIRFEKENEEKKLRKEIGILNEQVLATQRVEKALEEELLIERTRFAEKEKQLNEKILAFKDQFDKLNAELTNMSTNLNQSRAECDRIQAELSNKVLLAEMERDNYSKKTAHLSQLLSERDTELQVRVALNSIHCIFIIFRIHCFLNTYPAGR